MAANIYVSLTATGNGIGTSPDPYNYTQFTQSISGDIPDGQSFPNVGDRDYYISEEFKAVSANPAIWEFNGTDGDIINIYAISGENNPCKFIFTSNFNIKINSNSSLIIPTTSENFGVIDSVNIYNTLLQTNDYFQLINEWTDPDVILTFDNCWVIATSTLSNIGWHHKVNFINSNIKCTSFNTGVHTVSAINSIFAVDDITSITANNIILSNSVFTSALSDYYSFSEITSINNQEEWTEAASLSIDVSALTQEDINYLSSTWNEISASIGIQGYSRLFWGESARDGVGALYFPYLSATLSASATSANVPWTLDISATLSDNNISASSLNFNFDDGLTSSVSNVSASTISLEHSYSAANIYTPSIIAYSKNNWYSVNDTLILSALDELLSATFVTVDAITSAVITSAYINNTIAVSSTSYSGTPSSSWGWGVNFGDGTGWSDVMYIPADRRLYAEHIYVEGGYYEITVLLRNDAWPAQETSYITVPILVVQEVSQRTLYVDINRSYDSTATHEGTTGDPLDYDEMVSMTITGGTGVNYDTYKLKGFREISSTSEIINTNFLAKYTFDAWNLSVYGPWMIVKNDSHLENQAMSFIGSLIRGGLYYNKPRTENLIDYGSPIKISDATNMFIVNQGLSSDIESFIYETEISSTSAVIISAGTSASYSYLNEDFDSSAYDSWWNNDFSANSTLVSSVSGGYGAEFAAPGDFTQLTPYNISAEHLIIEYVEQMPAAIPVPDNNSFKVDITDCNGTYAGLRFIEDGDILRLISGFDYSGVGSDNIIENDTYVFTANANAYFRLEVSGGNVSAAHKTTSGGAWTYFTTPVQLSSCSYSISAEGSTSGLLNEINISALGAGAGDSGLPYNDGTSAISGTSAYLSSGVGGIDIIGCTIYTDTGFKTDREYQDNSLSSMSGSFIIEDSVITGLIALNDTSATVMNIYNNTFDKTQAQILGDFTVSANQKNQYQWIPPTNYPFVRTAGSSYGYNHNLDWVRANANIIAPFSGITTPPNPGKNFSSYPGYTTGLLGYSRSDYRRPT